MLAGYPGCMPARWSWRSVATAENEHERTRKAGAIVPGAFAGGRRVRAYGDPIPLVGVGLSRSGRETSFGRNSTFASCTICVRKWKASTFLVFSPGVIVVDAVESFTTRVYDRGQLLGTYTSTATGDDASLRFRSWFSAPGSIFAFGNPAHMDFSTLQNGTFDGHVEFEIHGGRVNLGRASDELDFDQTLSPDVASGFGFSPRTFELIPAPTPTPEPSSCCSWAPPSALSRWRAFVGVVFTERP